LAGLILLVVSSFFQRRFFCTTLCPAGNFLALFSGHSLYKLQLNDQKCINCSACEKICKTDCIDYKNNTIDNSECVTCFNCIAKCPTQAITFSKAKPIKKFQPNRRQVMKNTGLAAAFLLPLSLRKKIKPELTKNQPPVMPPGAKNIDHFTESCTACQLCAANCPTNVITPASFQYGLTGVFQPYMDFNFAYCEYDCNICVTICPSDALQQLNLETKQLTQMGTVELITDLCVVYKNDTDCGACAEACPTHAVYTEMENNINYPKTRTDICIGCGACQYMCPVSPKAIIVNANTEQILAEKPYDEQKGKGVQKPVDKSEEEFPF
jgi:ferredoxin